MGSIYFWLRSPAGLAIIAFASILPTLAIATWLGNTSDFLALLVGIGIAAIRKLAWMRWGDGPE